MIDAILRLPGFDMLGRPVIETIIRRSSVRSFEPGQLVIEAGVVPEALFARIEGGLIGASGMTAPTVFDAPGLLFGLGVREDHRAGPDGYSALAIAKPHIFTIAREFPEFVISISDHLAGRR